MKCVFIPVKRRLIALIQCRPYSAILVTLRLLLLPQAIVMTERDAGRGLDCFLLLVGKCVG